MAESSPMRGNRATLHQKSPGRASIRMVMGSPTGRQSMLGTTLTLMKKSESRVTEEIASRRRKILEDAEEAWNVVGSKVMVKHSFGSVVLPADPLLAFPGPPNDSSDKDFSDRVVYCAGSQVCIADADTGKQLFASGRDRRVTNVVHVAIDPSNAYLSVCERISHAQSGEVESECQLSIYKTDGLRLVCTLNHTPSPSAGNTSSGSGSGYEFVFSCFCGDASSRLVAALTSEPDRSIVVFNWDKGRVVRLQALPTAVLRLRSLPVTQPGLMLTTTGPAGGIKAWIPAGSDKDAQGALKSINLLPQKESSLHENFLDHCWLATGNGIHKMAALSEVVVPFNPATVPHGAASRATGQAFKTNVQFLYVFEGTNAPPHVGQGTNPSPPVLLQMRQEIIIKLDGTEAEDKIYSVVPSPKGFVLLGFKGHVLYFERTDDKREPYIQVSKYRVGDVLFVGGSVLASEDRLVAITSTGRLITAPVEQTMEQLKGLGCEGGPASDSASLGAGAEGSGALVGSGAADFCDGGFHSGPITAASLSKDRPVLATVCAQDNSCRVWNYQTQKCEAAHYFGSDDPLSVAMHNNGLQLLVSFKDRVTMFNVTLGSLRHYKETIQKSCREIVFSNGGQYWAGASGINLVVYDTTTFRSLATFQGHMMAIRRIAWAPGDQVVFSAAVDGTVYGWPIAFEGRIDVVSANQRSSAILGLDVDSASLAFPTPKEDESAGSISPASASASASAAASLSLAGALDEGYRCIVSTADGHIKLPPWLFSPQSLKSGVDLGSSLPEVQYIWGEEWQALTCISLSRTRRQLFAGTRTGAIRVYAWPPVGDKSLGVYVEHQLHSAPVVSVAETIQGTTLISVGEDGCIFVLSLVKASWSLKPMSRKELELAKSSAIGDQSRKDASEPGKKEEKKKLLTTASAATAVSSSKSKVEEEVEEDAIPLNSEVVLLSTDAMEEHVREVAALQKKVVNTIASCEYRLSQIEQDNAAETKRLTNRQDAVLAQERERADKMRDGYEKKVRELLAAFENKEADGLKTVSELENRYEHKLAEQLDRYDRLAEDMELLRQKCEGLLKAERGDFAKQLNDLRNETRLREKKMRAENRRIFEDRASDESAFKEILDQQETEYEDELRTLIGAAESELMSERDSIGKLRTLVQTKNTKIDQLKKKLTELSFASKARLTLLNNERAAKQKVMDTVEHYKRNLKEREVALAEKERIISDLRASTRTLENFRFVLDFRLQQLAAERGPIASHIEGLERHIVTMYEELVEEFENKRAQTVVNDYKDSKIALVAKELTHVKTAMTQKERYIVAFKTELNNIVSAAVTGKDLEESVRLLYRKYVKGETTGHSTVKVSEAATTQAQALTNIQADDDLSTIASNNNRYSGGGGGGLAGGGGGGGGGGGFKFEVEEALVEQAKEAERQKEFVSRGVTTLQTRLEATQKESAIMARRRLNENSNLLFEVNELRKQAHRLSETVANQVEQLKEKEVMILRLGGGRGGAAAHAHAHGGSYSQQLLAPLPLALTTSHSQAGEGGGAGLGAMTESSWGGAGGGSEEEKAPVTDTISRTGTPGNLNPPPSSTPAPAISGPPKSSSGAALRKSAVGVGLDGRKWVGQPLPSSGMLRSASTPLILHVMDSLASSTSAAAAASAAGGEGQRVSKDAGAGAEDGASVNSQVHSLQGGPVPTTSLRQGSRPPSPSPSPSAPAATAPAAAGGGGEQGKKAQPPPRLNVVMPAGGKASHERVVERLKAEALLLAEQLDIVSRERDHVRVENSQLRKQVRKFAAGQGSLVSSAGGGASQSHFEDSVGYSASSPVHGQHHGYDDNFDLESDAAAGSLVVSGKEAKHLAKRLTTADRTGKPSASDLKDLALGPAPALAPPASFASSSRGGLGGKGKQGASASKGRKVDLPPLPGSLEGGSSIETMTNAEAEAQAGAFEP